MSHALDILHGALLVATDADAKADIANAIAKLEAPASAGDDVSAALAAISAKVDALAAKIDGTQPPSGLVYVDGLRNPDSNGFAFSELLDKALAKNPALGIGPRVCVRTVLSAFPDLRPPVANGENLVSYNCNNAGFRQHNTYDYNPGGRLNADGTAGPLVPHVLSLYGRTRAEWEAELQALIDARAQDAAPGNTGDQFTPR